MKIKETWKPVTISGVSGILLGAGGVLGAQEATAATEEELTTETSDKIKETVMDDSMSFKHAFETARAELGTDGLFHWRGNIYSTCTAEEWKAKSVDEKDQVAQQVQEMTKATDVEAKDILDNAQVENDIKNSEDVQIAEGVASDDVATATIVTDESKSSSETDDDDVRVIGYGDIDLANGHTVTVEELEINGQRVAIIDVDKDGVGDIAMSDINHNNQPDDGEVIDLHTGDAISFGDQASYDETDISADFMPA